MGFASVRELPRDGKAHNGEENRENQHSVGADGAGIILASLLIRKQNENACFR